LECAGPAALCEMDNSTSENQKSGAGPPHSKMIPKTIHYCWFGEKPLTDHGFAVL